MEKIKAGETEAWLEESKGKFRCPSCGKPLPVFGWKKDAKKKCYHCAPTTSKHRMTPSVR